MHGRHHSSKGSAEFGSVQSSIGHPHTWPLTQTSPPPHKKNLDSYSEALVCNTAQLLLYGADSPTVFTHCRYSLLKRIMKTQWPTRVLARSSNILAENFRSFPQSLKLNSGAVPPTQPTNASFHPISNLIFRIIQPFGDTCIRFVVAAAAVVIGKGVTMFNPLTSNDL
jgi:hypothetical protein